MKENWKELIGKRILLRQKYLSTISITEATEARVVEVSESGKYVKFRWQSGSESWEIPEDEYRFNYDKLLEVLGPAPEEIEAGAIKAGIDTLLKILSDQEGKKPSVVPTEEKEPDITSNTLTGKIESRGDNTSVQGSKVDTSSNKIDNF